MRKLYLAVLAISFTLNSYASQVWITNDFFVQGKPTFQTSKDRSQDCRANIEKVLCQVNTPPGPDDWHTRPCYADGAQYRAQFEEIYDVLPPTFQQMFCSLKKIYIEG